MAEWHSSSDKSNGAGYLIDVTKDGDHYIEEPLSIHPSITNVYYQFLDEHHNETEATGGTITATGAPIGEIYLELANGNGTVNAVDVNDGTYTPPQFTDLIQRLRIVVTGVTGAKYLRAVAWRR